MHELFRMSETSATGMAKTDGQTLWANLEVMRYQLVFCIQQPITLKIADYFFIKLYEIREFDLALAFVNPRISCSDLRYWQNWKWKRRLESNCPSVMNGLRAYPDHGRGPCETLCAAHILQSWKNSITVVLFLAFELLSRSLILIWLRLILRQCSFSQRKEDHGLRLLCLNNFRFSEMPRSSAVEKQIGQNGNRIAPRIS